MIFWAAFADTAKVAENELLDSLLARTAMGDSEAFSELYTKTKSSVYGFALSILKNSHDAEDVLQNAFLSIHAAAGDYRSQGKPMAWILTVTRNLCMMQLREQKKLGEMPETLPDDLIIADETERSENRIFLEKCLSLLSTEERQILMLHAVSGMRHREIASLLQMPLATVLSKYHRAIKKIKNNLQ